jgi:hypothetical protein
MSESRCARISKYACNQRYAGHPAVCADGGSARLRRHLHPTGSPSIRPLPPCASALAPASADSKSHMSLQPATDLG